MKKALITGGCGFIGSAVADELVAAGCETHVIDDLSLGKNHWLRSGSGPKIHVQDILDFDKLRQLFEEIKPEVVFHLAAHHYIPFCERDPHKAYLLNVGATLTIMELCKRHEVKGLFFASTGDVYPPAFRPHREVDMVAPIYVYGHTKFLGEQLCLKYLETELRSCNGIIGRIFNAAGPRETNPHLIPEVVRQIVDGKKLIEVGNLWPRRDFVDVNSMAQVIVELTLHATGVEIVNIGSGVVQEIGQVLSILQEAAPHDVEIVSVKSRQRENDRPYLCPDVSRLRRMIGQVAKPFDRDTAARIFKQFG